MMVANAFYMPLGVHGIFWWNIRAMEPPGRWSRLLVGARWAGNIHIVTLYLTHRGERGLLYHRDWNWDKNEYIQYNDLSSMPQNKF